MSQPPATETTLEFPGTEPSEALRIQVLALLSTPAVPLKHGQAVTGRPLTRIHRDAQRLLKIRGELNFPAHDARRWVNEKRREEQAYGVHHPDKQWLLAHQGGRTLIANLTPLLSPLHLALERLPPEAAVGRLAAVVDRVLRIGARHDRLLDSGLSNFGEDAAGGLFYLDDDIYPWDRFLSLSQVLAHWFRTFPWLADEPAADLGRRCRAALAKHFPQPITPVTFSNHLRDLPLPGRDRQAALQTFLAEINRRTRGAPPSAPGIPRERPLPDFRGGGPRPIAILADVHANLPALEAVLEDIGRQDCDGGLVLGDLVGYGPHPRECVERIRGLGFHVLLGNHDYGVAHGEFARGFSSTGRQVAEWSAGRLNDGQRDWLAALPDTLEGPGWMAVHGAPADKSRMLAYVYRMTYEANLDYLEQRGIPLCFHGHTHVEGTWYRATRGDGFEDAPQQALDDYHHCLVCPGSVGQPRGGNGCEARYALFHPRTRRIELRRVPYDLQRTLDDMQRNGLPRALGERLRKGI